jgi:hypothetical protein
MTNTIKTQEIPAIRVDIGRRPNKVVWESRYEGCAAVAHVNGEAIAGISGPWSDKYALTWWGSSMPQRPLELFDSLEAAKREVERRAPPTSRLSTLIHILRRNSVSVARASWRNSVRALLPQRNHERKHLSPKNTLNQLRQMQLLQGMDLQGMSFRAFE